MERSFWELAEQCTDLSKAGCAIAWGLANARDKIHSKWKKKMFEAMFGPDVWHKAGNRRAFPLRVGDLKPLLLQLRGMSLEAAASPDFSERWGQSAWLVSCLHACNCVYGYSGPLKEGSWSKAERRAVTAMSGAVNRALCHGHETVPCDLATIEELKKKRLNYHGEEVGTCHRLTLRQILPALPPKGHGASIDAVDYLSTYSRYLLENPHVSVLPDDGRPLPKLTGIIHADANEMKLIAAELTDRGVCGWTRLEDVATYRGQRILNGLFGVEKPSKLSSGEPILRLIMNLVASNSILRQFAGATGDLPSITAWLSTVVSDTEELQFWQSDMCNAFYLFHIPDCWQPYLCFNHIEERLNHETQRVEPMALSCRVLPMGWLSSVSIMQEISERILLTRGVDPEAQLTRTKPLPRWMVGIITEARKSSRCWWHIYLDNFAAGQIVSGDNEVEAGNRLHDSAELAWSAAGVQSSEKKRASAISRVEELGAYVDGKTGFRNSIRWVSPLARKLQYGCAQFTEVLAHKT
eukprot:Skav215449  [mRNA]  locus=scaffold2193:99355:102374:- [translate_table: standard]